MGKNYLWCGYHRVPMSRCEKTSSGNCGLLKLSKKESDKLKKKKNKEGYDIKDYELLQTIKLIKPFCHICRKENIPLSEIEKDNAIGSGDDGLGHNFWHKERFCKKGNGRIGSGEVIDANKIDWAKED